MEQNRKTPATSENSEKDVFMQDARLLEPVDEVRFIEVVIHSSGRIQLWGHHAIILSVMESLENSGLRIQVDYMSPCG